jgi:hypothetical protein
VSVVCKSCGSDQVGAWYKVWEFQGLEGIHRVTSSDGRDLGFAYEYDGCTKSGEAEGSDEEFTCLGCGETAYDLDELVHEVADAEVGQ